MPTLIPVKRETGGFRLVFGVIVEAMERDAGIRDTGSVFRHLQRRMEIEEPSLCAFSVRSVSQKKL